MDYYGSEINKLIDQLETLPGIGRKSAQRLAFHVIHMPEENVKALSERKKKKLIRHLKARRFWDRLAGFIIVFVIVLCSGLLGLEYVILKGPSPALRDLFISTRQDVSALSRRSS